MSRYEVTVVEGERALAEAFAVRRAVFVDEQDVPESVEVDGHESEAVHLLARDTARDEPVGAARLRVVDADTGKAERVAVLRPYRGVGLGRRLVRRLESVARSRGCSRMVLDAQTHVEGFYRGLGYERTSDDVFYEAAIPHVEMHSPLA
jgi:predicted GNAT family N-acyltransferase